MATYQNTKQKLFDCKSNYTKKQENSQDLYAHKYSRGSSLFELFRTFIIGCCERMRHVLFCIIVYTAKRFAIFMENCCEIWKLRLIKSSWLLCIFVITEGAQYILFRIITIL